MPLRRFRRALKAVRPFLLHLALEVLRDITPTGPTNPLLRPMPPHDRRPHDPISTALSDECPIHGHRPKTTPLAIDIYAGCVWLEMGKQAQETGRISSRLQCRHPPLIPAMEDEGTLLIVIREETMEEAAFFSSFGYSKNPRVFTLL